VDELGFVPRDGKTLRFDPYSEELGRFGRDRISGPPLAPRSAGGCAAPPNGRGVRIVFGLYVVFTVSLLVLYIGIGLTAR
jgi:hypothetical protein